MRPSEIGLHLRKKLCQWQDARRVPDWSALKLIPSPAFPALTPPGKAPPILREALTRDCGEVLAGRWRAFGHLEIQVDTPPHWHADYLVRKGFSTDRIAFKLNHRELPGGGDVKLIWELSRWHQLARLAQAAYVLDDANAAKTCVRWLDDWREKNPPYRGLNWTSALEVGVRLVQFTWIDALLTAYAIRGSDLEKAAARSPSSRTSPREEGDSSGGFSESSTSTSQAPAEVSDPLPGGPVLRGRTAEEGEHRGDHKGASRGAVREAVEKLRCEVLPPHVWYAWRYRSFGSSANNHLLGELTGLILAAARWPELAAAAAPLEQLQALWEKEVLAQFAEDGGNREQALNYHLFSWEFCWQARLALTASGRTVSSAVDERLRRALDFLLAVQVDDDVWDYGDSDNGFVTPFFADWNRVRAEWRTWLRYPESSPAFRFWLGNELPATKGDATNPSGGWRIFPESGIAVQRSEDWTVRWDVSPMGYLSTAAHGHLDALHLSIWRRSVAIVIDPGTGAYYADQALRTHLASWEAHNGPHAVGRDFPKRLGPFLWSKRHADPNLKPGSDSGLLGELKLPSGSVSRKVTMLPREEGWRVEDCFRPDGRTDYEFEVHWQFAPESRLERMGDRKFRVARHGETVEVEVDANWSSVEPVLEKRDGSFDGICSPGYRETCFAPCLKLAARGHNPCVFATTFLASHRSSNG